MPAGRPTTISDEITTEICTQLADGKSLLRICKDPNLPCRATVLLWVVKGIAGDEQYKQFSDTYAQAREANGHAHADRVIELTDEVTQADGLDANRARVAIDGLKWAAAVMAQKQFAPRTRTEHTGKDGAPIQTEDVTGFDLARRIAFLMTKQHDGT